jgi:hypothetical protein
MFAISLIITIIGLIVLLVWAAWMEDVIMNDVYYEPSTSIENKTQDIKNRLAVLYVKIGRAK